jgi:hypothetical protein
MMGAAAVLTAVILLITLNLDNWKFVSEIELVHLIGLYEIAFSLIPVFIFSQLFAEELEEDIFKWLFSLPLNRVKLGLERWLLGMAILLGSYYGSLAVIHFTVMNIPWASFTTEALIPSLWLGHLTLLCTLLFRDYRVGLAVPLVHWTIESLSHGVMTKQWSLFMATMPVGDHLTANRLLYVVLSAAALGLSLLILKRGVKGAA